MFFVAIDVETANPDPASICQIGIAEFDQYGLFHEWGTLINPQMDFDYRNIKIHGISRKDVKKAPILPRVRPLLMSKLQGKVIVSHSSFEKNALSNAFLRYGQKMIIAGHWLDSAKVARRTWPEVAQRGYNLKNVCSLIGYEFKHHDALEDAKAAGQIVLASMAETGLDVPGLIDRCNKPIKLKQTAKRS